MNYNWTKSYLVRKDEINLKLVICTFNIGACSITRTNTVLYGWYQIIKYSFTFCDHDVFIVIMSDLSAVGCFYFHAGLLLLDSLSGPTQHSVGFTQYRIVSTSNIICWGMVKPFIYWCQTMKIRTLISPHFFSAIILLLTAVSTYDWTSICPKIQ